MNRLEFPRRDGARFPANHLADPNTVTGTPPQVTRILTIVRRRKWLIAGATAATLLLGLLITLLMTPKYTATSTLDIQRERGNFIHVQDAEQSGGYLDQEFYETQYGLLEADSLAEQVAISLKLPDDPHFFALFDSRLAEEAFANGRPRPGAATRDERVEAASKYLLKYLDIAPARRSRLVKVSFTSPDPNLSKRVVDAWAKGFIQITLDRRFEATSYARTYLEDRLAQLRQRIDQSERMLVGYAGQEGIVNLPAGTLGATNGVTVERPLAADDLAIINRELGEASAARVRAQSRLGARPGEVSEALENGAISDMRRQRAAAAAEYARMTVQFEPAYMPARALQKQIEQLDRAIAREELRVQNTLRETYRAARSREAALRGEMSTHKTNLLDQRRRSIQYNIYQREVDTNRQLYDALLQRYKEIGIAGGVGVNNISIVDLPRVPKKPSSPNLPLNLVLSLLVGLGLGITAASLLEQTDQGVTDPAEVETDLGLPLLGTLPKVASGNPIEALQDSKSSLTEAYHSLTTRLAFSTDHGIPKTLAVTSSRPTEGKTTTAFALASAIAKSNGRVLLIDGDMRSPSVHRLFGIPNQEGLSNYLAGNAKLKDVVRETTQPGLFVMTAGPQPPSAPELLSGDGLERLIAAIGEEFGHAVFDAPPVMGLADAPLIGSVVEGMIFVIEANKTQKSMARIASRRLWDASAQILGVALTKFDARHAHYGYAYDYGYGYEYGPGGDGKA